MSDIPVPIRADEHAKEEFLYDLSEKINAAMIRQGLDKYSLAERAKISPAQMTKILRGENFSLRALVRVALALEKRISISLVDKKKQDEIKKI